ncbi:MATE family efflux transporter [Chroococcidiopsis sp. FACHB-1243]|uniref:MATE family efflux transporter n=1 Tax=Chroococcidiopsis sp. [FACHB-1243] TaxID=2692781 RepID=UPI001782D9A9|nr:MATE family efflux transporter [Chroococcidiopsis sp. [FACHB-1243]]MBD2309007.1 MATE family efflux transporter [Chroococcidiopsis sp. [FACHB-1243]]
MTSQQQSKVTQEILNGNLIQLMLKLTIPGILGMLLIGMNTFLDALFAGQLIGETALAAISLALPLTSIVIGCAHLVGVGCASVLSRAIGSEDAKTKSKIFGTLTIMSLIIGLLLTFLGHFWSEELIVFMGGNGEVATLGAAYFKDYTLGSVFYILAVASSQLIKSEGKIRLAMIFAGLFVVIDAILNPIFISAFNLGLRGVALSTVVSMLIYSILNIAYFLSNKSSIPVNSRKITLAIDLLPAILSVGISALLMEVISLVEQSVIFKSIAHYGTAHDIAVAGATLRVFALATIPIEGFVQALQPAIGMNYGAKKYHRLKKVYFTFGVGGTLFLGLIWLPLQLFPATFLSILLPSVNFSAADLFNFQIINALLLILPLGFCSVTFFQSIGNGKLAGILILSKSLFFLIPLVLILSRYLGVRGVYYGMLLTDFLTVSIALSITWIEFKKLSDKTQMV